MEIAEEENQVQISVGELANLHTPLTRASTGASGLWRAKVGQEWHKTAETLTRQKHPDAEFERPITAQWPQSNWTFSINGRIDQLIPTQDGWLIREIKTVRQSLPISKETLRESHPNHIAQAGIYRELLKVLPDFYSKKLRAELVLFEIENGTSQIISIEPEDFALEQQIEKLLPFLESRKVGRCQMREFKVSSPYPQLREGQAEAAAQLSQSLETQHNIIFSAPTGFGKTGLILEQVLTLLQKASFSRCIYLTSRSTGQIEVANKLREMTAGHLKWIQMRSRAEHMIESASHTCTGDSRCDRDFVATWDSIALSPDQLFQNGNFTTEQAKQLGAKHGLCPYALTRACLPYAHLWIADYNYIFSPSSRSIFTESLGFSPKDTILIIDEAHNLPERAAEALSVDLDQSSLIFTSEAIRECGKSSRLPRILDYLSDYLARLPAKEQLPARDFYEILDIAEDFQTTLENHGYFLEELPPYAIDTIGKLQRLASSLDDPSHEWFHWVPESGKVKASCLSHHTSIRMQLKEFGKVIMQSATVDPLSEFSRECGLESRQFDLVRGNARWRDDAYNVAIDTRVDTRLKSRKAYYETTARTLAEAAWASLEGPIAAFFPSYHYAESVVEYLRIIAPGLRIGIQQRGGNLEENEAYMERSLLENDILIFIIGSHFSEGIDQLGGRVSTCIVVGPALSEMNLLLRHRMSIRGGPNSEEAFREVCAIPAMRKIHQAIGRLVRAPNHRAKVLLHCKRFAQSLYSELLLPEYHNETLVTTNTQLREWLST